MVINIDTSFWDSCVCLFQDDFREYYNSVPKKTVISIDHPDEPNRVVIFNSHARRRSEIVTVIINMPNVKVNDDFNVAV